MRFEGPFAAGRPMQRWSDERVWEAADAWRWYPPASRRFVGRNFELAVTPGNYALSYAYGFNAADAEDADRALSDVRKRAESLGGNGIRVRVTPRSAPADIHEVLQRRSFRLVEEAEVLVSELLDERDEPRLPAFRPVPDVVVREAVTETEYDAFRGLSRPIFGGPEPSEESLEGFRAEFRRALEEHGHSDRYVAWGGARPIGRAGMELAGEVVRLWGTGVLPEDRGRGVYGLLVRARCDGAVRRGAKIALVIARTGTSGPILKRHGFRALGADRLYEARWGPGDPASAPEDPAPARLDRG
jgi:hypothetical protein